MAMKAVADVESPANASERVLVIASTGLMSDDLAGTRPPIARSPELRPPMAGKAALDVSTLLDSRGSAARFAHSYRLSRKDTIRAGAGDDFVNGGNDIDIIPELNPTQQTTRKHEDDRQDI